MLVCSVSASVLLKWRGAAVPITFRVTRSVIIAAASADPVADLVILLDFSKSISRKKYHTEASDGTTLG